MVKWSTVASESPSGLHPNIQIWVLGTRFCMPQFPNLRLIRHGRICDTLRTT
jgi:hypothetical protein